MIPTTGSVNPVKSKGGAIQSVKIPKPLSSGSMAMQTYPMAKKAREVIKNEKSFLENMSFSLMAASFRRLASSFLEAFVYVIKLEVTGIQY
jgi:hypothetical protein